MGLRWDVSSSHGKNSVLRPRQHELLSTAAGSSGAVEQLSLLMGTTVAGKYRTMSSTRKYIRKVVKST